MKDLDKEKQSNKESQNKEKENNVDDEINKEGQRLDIDPEVLEKIVSELEEKYNLKKENIKILKVNAEPSKKKVLRSIIRDFMFWIFDFLLIISLNGYLMFSEPNIIKLLLYSIIFYIIEYVSRIMLNKYYQKLVIYSFGSILIPITIIALILAQLAVGFESINNNNLLAFYILFLIVRNILRFIIMRKEIRVMMKGRRK